MSILAQTSTDQSGQGAVWVLVVSAALLALSLGVAIALRVVPPRNVSASQRIGPDRPAWPLVAVLFGAGGVYLFTQSFYLGLRYPHGMPASAELALSMGDTAFLSTVPPLITFLALLAGDGAVRHLCRQNLGLGRRRIGQGFLLGLLGAVIVVPPLFLLSEVVELIYQSVHYAHETEHPLLKVLGERPGPMVMAAIIIGACVIAPLFEETLFRAHLQTLLRRGIERLFARRTPPPAGLPVVTDAPGPGPIAPTPQPVLPQRQAAWQVWLALVITSLLFALVHPIWMSPMIVTLAICLGYAYERTGNLWVSITMHAIFNSVSTVVFLGFLSR